MTDITEKYTKTEEAERVVKTVCDWCGEEITKDDPRHNEYEPTIHARTAYSNYGSDGGFEEGWEVSDLCKSCCVKLRKLLEDNGIKITEIDRSW